MIKTDRQTDRPIVPALLPTQELSREEERKKKKKKIEERRNRGRMKNSKKCW